MLRGKRLLALLVVAAVVLVLAGRAARDHVAARNEAAEEARMATSELRAQAEFARAQGLDLEKLDAAYRDLVATLPFEPELAELIESLVALESNTGATLTILSVDEPGPVAGSDDAVLEHQRQITLVLEVYGVETLVRSFVGGLRGLPRLVVVDKVDLLWDEPAGEDGEQSEEIEGGGVNAVLYARAFMWTREFFEEVADTGVRTP